MTDATPKVGATPQPSMLRRRLGRLGSAVLALGALLMIAAAAAMAVALVAGVRPVVLTTGSMDPTAPPGSLVVAAPTDELGVGDVVVMQREGRATVTHRIVEIETAADGTRFAVTRGDANAEVDAEPYPLGGEELVGRWIVPGAGRWLTAFAAPWVALTVVTLVVGTLLFAVLRRIWQVTPTPVRATASAPATAPARASTGMRGRRTRRPMAAAVGIAALVGGGGVAWSLYLGLDSVSANTFTTADCFDSRLGGVQSGSLTHAVDGTMSATIAAIDPTTSFLVHTVRSSADDVDGAQVSGRLVDGTTIEFVRATDDGVPAPIEIEWSVVTYDCGVSVQRGVVAGDGSTAITVPITTVDPASSFVTLSSAAPGTHVGWDTDDRPSAALAATQVDITASGEAIPTGSSHAWQVVTWDAPGDIAVQRPSVSLDAATTTTTVALASPVDPDGSFLLADVASPGTVTPSVGAVAVRVRFLDPSTVEVQRAVGGVAIDVQLQVVEFLDGTTVRHGVIDLAGAETTGTATIDPVDPTRTTVFSSSPVPGSASGGSTDHAASSGVGEASVTAVLADPTTVAIERGRSTAASSFAWQAVSWGGPGWGDPLSPFRQRIDVTAGAVDAPDGYTLPLDLDHAALVASGLSLASGDDLRVWHHDGTTWTELDRVLDESSTWNAVDSRFWFRTVAAVDAGTTDTYWLYYGDQSPPAPLADPDAVWLLREGFESGDLGAFEDRTGGTAWYRADPWAFGRTITIESSTVPGTLTDQLVRVSLVDPALAGGDGSDIRFTAADGSTPVPHDIEWFDPATGTVHAWVRVPTIEAVTDTLLWMYDGAPDAPDQTDPRSVWLESNWTFAADPAGAAPTLDDESRFGLDGIALADTARTITSDGPAVDLDGATDRLESAPTSFSAGVLSASVVVVPDTPGSDQVFLAHGDPTTTGSFELSATAGSQYRLAVRSSSGVVAVTGGTVATAPAHIAFTYDGTNVELFVDGVSVGMAAAPSAFTFADETAVVIGGDPAGSRTFDGRIGHARIAEQVWSADRLAFEAANHLANGTTITVGATIADVNAFDQGDWSERRPLTVPAGKVTGVLTDFPLLVQLTDAALGAAAQADGDDLVFTASDGVTRLDHQIEAWDAAAGTLTAWVRIPALDGSVDTELFLYSGNPTAADQQDPPAVWGPDADLVLDGTGD